MEVLTAYVRENSHWEPKEPSTSTTAPSAGVEQERGGEQDAQPTLRGLPPDIQAVLDVLIRREEEHVPEEHRVILALRQADLRSAYLRSAYLRGEADLQDANLYRADLRRANLQDANLYRANVQEANLQDADLQEANLRGAHLQGANLQGANLQGAIVFVQQLADARDLQRATMPDGQKYENWLKDKEGSGQDVENE